MSEINIYDNLLSLPLFLGMSRSEIQQAAGQAKFDFKKMEEGTTIVSKGELCTHLYFLLMGDIIVSTEAEDAGYQIEEDITAPEIFQPERIFGLRQQFTHTYIAQKNCNILCIDKKDVLKLSDRLDIFRINLLNLISTQSQKMYHCNLKEPPKNLEERIIRFIQARCIRPTGAKMFYIKMTRIAQELNDSRLNISKALNHLEAEGFIELHRGRIHIPALEKLTNR